MKRLFQDLWKEEIQWDDPLPTHIEKEWKKWCEKLLLLRNLKISRLVLDSILLEDDVELHSFCDACKKAYCAAIYLRTKSRNGISVKLVTFTARLASKVKKIVNLKRSCLQYHWTDSKIVLFWIKGNRTRWKQFIANRVNEITSLTDPHSWYHCADKENPVDFLSRGLSADCLVSNSRFNYNCRNKSKKVEPLTVAESKESEIKLIKNAQRSLFDKKEIPSSISNLFPFVDGEGIVRVGGRLENASVLYLHKHPAILPKGSKLSKLYFNSVHTRLFHVGPQGLLNAVRQKFWPLRGRTIARKIVHQCATCFKSRPVLSLQIMGNLPSKRVNISSPFTIAGLDLCGPFLVKYKNQIKGTLNKVYICICICFSTKAIHLELLSDLTSDDLIATLKRFTSRREFIPPKSPHLGGLWEAGVKSVKHHLKRAIGNLHFTFEEFETIMIQVEGILNSRPLTPLSNDADNFDVLTPGHFLIGRPITSIPEPNLIDVNENRLSRWEKITKVVQRTWKK
ncbi:integrase catalytic domain-containing protein [Trichonephila clavipes]|nr:integrase catalytic domain-containing protein [Trichonephila clavipes]